MEVMAHFQREIPDPLIDTLPALLTPGSMTTPTIGVLFAIFIRERDFKGSAMQVECHHIGSGESALWQGRA